MHAPDTKTSTPSEAQISLIIGGPFHSLVGRLGLLGPDRLLGVRAAVVLAAVAWLLPAVLAVLQALLTNDRYALGYFTDPSAVARLLVGVFALVITERTADTRLSILFDNLLGPHLVAVRDRDTVLGALLKADRWTSSRVAEAVMLAVALISPGFLIEFAINTDPSAWEGRVVVGGVEMSWAGIGARYASIPLMQFLLLRWFWRLAVWTWLLFSISRMPLQLSVLHPDRSGGLAFLSLYPPVFNGLIFAISSGFAAAFIRDLAAETIAVQTVQMMVVAWILLVLVLVIGPLLVFAPCLLALKGNAIIRYGRLAAGVNQAFESRWLAPEARGEDLLASGDSGAVSDLNAIAASIWELNVIPVKLPTVMSVALAAGVPMLAVLATRMPLRELAERLFSVLL